MSRSWGSANWYSLTQSNTVYYIRLFPGLKNPRIAETNGDGAKTIDAYTGGLAELPVQGGLVRFLVFKPQWHL